MEIVANGSIWFCVELLLPKECFIFWCNLLLFPVLVELFQLTTHFQCNVKSAMTETPF